MIFTSRERRLNSGVAHATRRQTSRGLKSPVKISRRAAAKKQERIREYSTGALFLEAIPKPKNAQ
jgi:hypothetical protein